MFYCSNRRLWLAGGKLVEMRFFPGLIRFAAICTVETSNRPAFARQIINHAFMFNNKKIFHRENPRLEINSKDLPTKL